MKLKFWLLKAAAFLVLDCRLYYCWSLLGRWLFERSYVRKPIAKYANDVVLEAVMATWQWRADPWWQLWDMISCPAAVEARGQKKEPVGDCDDFSVYAATALQQIANDSNGIVGGAIVKDISLLTIPWMSKSGALDGHNVCVFRYLVPGEKWVWAWVSNWFGCKIQWSRTTGLYWNSLEEIVAYVVGDGRNTRWARVSTNLWKVYETGSV